MASTYDVAVVGLGAMGSAAAYQLSKEPGLRVLGLDMFEPPHAHGSTHGDTRATRSAPFEGDELVPMARRSVEIYAGELSEASGVRLFNRSGGLIIGRPGERGYHNVENPFKSTVDAAQRHGIEFEILTPADVARRYPAVSLRSDEMAYYEPSGGFLYAEACVRAHLERARANGADLNYGEPVLGYVDTGAGVRVTTGKATYDVGTVVVSAGPWVARLMPELRELLQLQRLVLFWFELVERSLFDAYATMPRVGWAFGSGAYAFPALDGPDGGVKVACEDFTQIDSPEAIDRQVSAEEVATMFADNVEGRLVGLGPRAVRTATCIYTMTPDSRFVIDRHPQRPNVIIASPCSGHGFKYSAAIGEILAQLVTVGGSSLDIAPFALARFSSAV